MEYAPNLTIYAAWSYMGLLEVANLKWKGVVDSRLFTINCLAIGCC